MRLMGAYHCFLKEVTLTIEQYTYMVPEWAVPIILFGDCSSVGVLNDITFVDDFLNSVRLELGAGSWTLLDSEIGLYMDNDVNPSAGNYVYLVYTRDETV